MQVNDEDAEGLEIVLRAMYGIAYQPPKTDSVAPPLPTTFASLPLRAASKSTTLLGVW